LLPTVPLAQPVKDIKGTEKRENKTEAKPAIKNGTKSGATAAPKGQDTPRSLILVAEGGKREEEKEEKVMWKPLRRRGTKITRIAG